MLEKCGTEKAWYVSSATVSKTMWKVFLAVFFIDKFNFFKHWCSSDQMGGFYCRCNMVLLRPGPCYGSLKLWVSCEATLEQSWENWSAPPPPPQVEPTSTHDSASCLLHTGFQQKNEGFHYRRITTAGTSPERPFIGIFTGHNWFPAPG